MAPYIMMKLMLVGFCLVYMTAGQYTFDDSNGLGRIFDGIGGLSGGGATSKLLPGYPETLRNEILDYLFKPNFGASIQILKVEIGGGSMSGIGSEASHIYYDGDENYERGYEWWIMKEAKLRNPKIKLYGLPWVFSGWVGNGTNSPYKYPSRTVEYIIKWIQGAKTHHGLDIDYIGEWNEQDYNITYLKMLRQGLDKNGLAHVKIVAPDDFQSNYETNLPRDMLLDVELSSAIDYFGVHYSSTQSNMGSIMWGKQLWASEDYSSFNDEKGARCWARILNQNYVNGLMTSTISWNLIAAYYEGMPYQRCGLMTANSPWSGHYDVDPTIWMTAHTTQFTEPGWSYLNHHSGVGILVDGGSYVALTNPDKTQLTIIIETIDATDSQCLHESLQPFSVTNQTVNFKLDGSFKEIQLLHVWFSQIGTSAQDNVTVLFYDKGIIEPDFNGIFTLDVDINQVYTLSTVENATKGIYSPPPDPAPFPLPYMDNFEDTVEHQEPYFVAPMAGSFEVIVTPPPNNKVLRQMAILPPVDWCETENFTLALIGNITWTDIYVETSVSIDMPNATEGVFLAQRIITGGCYTEGGQGFMFYVFPKTATYEFWGDIRRATLLGYGSAPNLKAKGFNKLGLKVKGGFAEGYVNDKLVFGVRMPTKFSNGFPAFGTAGFGHADFDYIMITES